MRWDIFCQIIDNYGDAGVCWRLARSLANQHHQNIRLFCDDLHTLKLLMMGVTNTKNIEVLPWEASYQNARHPVDPPNVVIQAFSCELPARYLQNLLIAPQKPILINLEYLSAEAWVADFHSKPSPQGHGLQKYFFFPGFQDNTGGLLLDPIPSPQSQVPTSLVPIWKQCRADSVKISVFSYPGAPIKLWLDSFNQLNAPCDVLLAFGNAELLQLQQQSWTNLNLISMPFIPQDDYDWLLSQCDLNIVRGEDSFIRAQLAGKPFIWNIYPQDDGAHEVKLNAFLNLYLRNTAPELKQIIHQAMNWSDPQQWWSYRAAWESHAKDWRDQILKEQADGGLAARLLRFVS
jgi:uncharacterized repeat protein (TIGR03837 family)